MTIDLKPLPMAEAVEFWRAKVLLTPAQFYKLADQYKVRAFTVSRLARASMLQELHDSLLHVLESGQSFGDWKKSLGHVWEENGWTGKVAWRMDNIFRTNVQTAYNVGRYKQMMAVAQARPYWQYSAVNDSRTRPTHRALHGRVYRADSPFWDTWYPPNGFRCRCKVKTLSERQVRERGLDVLDGNGLGELIEPVGPNGPMPARPLMPDRGFEGNPGKEAWTPDLSGYPDWMRAKLEKTLVGATQASPLPDIGQAAVRSVTEVMPNAEAPFSPVEKVGGYILNFESEGGRHKARVIAAAFDLTDSPADVEYLAGALTSALPSGTITREHETRWGKKFDVDLVITGPNGHVETMSTTWQYDRGSDRPRLVTAFLRGKKK